MKQEVEVMRVLRVPPMGKLVIEYRGKRYQHISEVAEENVKRFLLTAVAELIVFSDNYQNLVDQGVAPPIAPPVSAAPARDDSEGELPEGESLTEQQARFLTSLEAARDATKAERKRSTGLPGIQGVNPMPSPALNPVQQIDRILQKHVDADPELSNRNIHLVQHPAGGLQIEVDGKRYQRPAEIEDPRIQLLIKKAVKEWEAI